MQALDDILRSEWEQEVWRSYMAGALWRLDGAWGGKDMPRYEDLIDHQQQEEELTQEQILEKRRKMIEKNNGKGGEGV